VIFRSELIETEVCRVNYWILSVNWS